MIVRPNYIFDQDGVERVDLKSYEYMESDGRFKKALLVQSENAYSVVAKWNWNTDKPFRRFHKHRDEKGLFVLLYRRRRFYQEDWIYL